MDEYISREAVINITAETGALETQNRVRELPAADVQPIVYAHKTISVGRRSYCSNCGKLAIMEDFCSKCGAKVKGGGNND